MQTLPYIFSFLLFIIVLDIFFFLLHDYICLHLQLIVCTLLTLELRYFRCAVIFIENEKDYKKLL